jgi:hypothetical protein
MEIHETKKIREDHWSNKKIVGFSHEVIKAMQT